DLIDEVGPDGQYLDRQHTLAHFRERWYPTNMDRGNYANWQARGSKTLQQRAAEHVSRILFGHKPEPLPGDVAKAVHNIVERAEAHYGNAKG
ncbi:MAG TPA: trimethylamine methyltransferase family protein, partial [Anaerolineae bacterium]|nr:trimethylamine methyltransferase family protein [Anaerolineae bacterium]